MDPNIPISKAGLPITWSILCLLAIGPVCTAAETAESTKPNETPAVQVESLLDQLYPNQSDLLRSLSATTTTKEALPATHVDRTGDAKNEKKRAGSMIIYGRRPVLPTITTKGDGIGTTSTQLVTKVNGANNTMHRRLKSDLLTTETLRRLQQAQTLLPDVPLALLTPLQSRAPRMPVTAASVIRPASVTTVESAPSAPLPNLTNKAVPAGGDNAASVNTATVEELMEKLKLDARRARLVVQFRILYGPFKTPEDLAQVSGITDDMVLQWEDEDLLSF